MAAVDQQVILPADGWLEYGGFRLKIHQLGREYRLDHEPPRVNWTVVAVLNGENETLLCRALMTAGGIVRGIKEEPHKVISICHVKTRLGFVEWGLWARPLTELEKTQEHFKEIAHG